MLCSLIIIIILKLNIYLHGIHDIIISLKGITVHLPSTTTYCLPCVYKRKYLFHIKSIKYPIHYLITSIQRYNRNIVESGVKHHNAS